MDTSVSPAAALELLCEGNRRFVAGDPRHPHQDAAHRAAVAPQQRPFAVLFGCSDSRLAAEIIFDRGLGDLFVVRTAGHVVGEEVLGSVEYAVGVLDAPLVAVLGHDSCGAVAAALAAVDEGGTGQGAIRAVVDKVRPSVLALPPAARTDPQAVMEQHLRATCQLLVRRSALIGQRVATGECAVVGMSYRLAEGSVRVLDSHGLEQS